MSEHGGAPQVEFGLSQQPSYSTLGHRVTAGTPVQADGGHAAARGWQTKLWQTLERTWKRSAVIGILFGLVVGSLAGIVQATGATTYTSQTTMILDDPLGLALAGDEGELVKLSDLRLKYQSLVATEAIAGPVADSLHIPVGEVLGATSVQVPASSLLMEVDATWATPAFAPTLSLAVAREIQAYVKAENATYAIPASDQFQALILTPASGSIPSSPSKKKAALLALGVLVGGAAAGFVVNQLMVEPRRRRAF